MFIVRITSGFLLMMLQMSSFIMRMVTSMMQMVTSQHPPHITQSSTSPFVLAGITMRVRAPKGNFEFGSMLSFLCTRAVVSFPDKYDLG